MADTLITTIVSWDLGGGGYCIPVWFECRVLMMFQGCLIAF